MGDFFTQVELIVDGEWQLDNIPQESLIQLPLPKDSFEYVRTEAQRKSETEASRKPQELFQKVTVPIVQDDEVQVFHQFVTSTNVSSPSIPGMLSASTQTETFPVSCNCTKSKCTKKYCPCFNANGKCGPSCTCKNCLNV
jgi:hypothetical protein